MVKDLGKSLTWLDETRDNDKITLVDVDSIDTNPFQPRKTFVQEKIEELAQSIKVHGLLQPVIVRKSITNKNRYQLVAGERRVMACKKLGLRNVPAIVKSLTDNAMATIALIENLQRENLHFMEEAEGYSRLIEEFNFTQEVLAQRIGKNQSTIANKLRLLKLPEKAKDILRNGELTERHARALLKINDHNIIEEIIGKVMNKKLNVKQTEALIEEKVNKKDKNKEKDKEKDSRKQKRIARDLRVFINTIRHSLDMVRKFGLEPDVQESDEDNYYEIVIRLPKRKK